MPDDRAQCAAVEFFMIGNDKLCKGLVAAHDDVTAKVFILAVHCNKRCALIIGQQLSQVCIPPTIEFFSNLARTEHHFIRDHAAILRAYPADSGQNRTYNGILSSAPILARIIQAGFRLCLDAKIVVRRPSTKLKNTNIKEF